MLYAPFQTRYVIDEYVDVEYSDTSINVGRVMSVPRTSLEHEGKDVYKRQMQTANAQMSKVSSRSLGSGAALGGRGGGVGAGSGGGLSLIHI